MDTGPANDKVVSAAETPTPPSPVAPPPAASLSFDFAAHERTAISEYLKEQPFYVDLASVIARVIEECLRKRDIKVQSVQHRAKNPSSFGRKAAVPSEEDPGAPKYPEPLKQITDLAGVRIITYFPGTVKQIDKLFPRNSKSLNDLTKVKS